MGQIGIDGSAAAPQTRDHYMTSISNTQRKTCARRFDFRLGITFNYRSLAGAMDMSQRTFTRPFSPLPDQHSAS